MKIIGTISIVCIVVIAAAYAKDLFESTEEQSAIPESTQSVASIGTFASFEELVTEPAQSAATTSHATTTSTVTGAATDGTQEQSRVLGMFDHGEREPETKTPAADTTEKTQLEDQQIAEQTIVLSESSYETRLVLEMHRLTNAARSEHGLKPHIYDVALARIAKQHTEDMMDREYFGHVTPRGCDIECRLERDGYDPIAWAENIAWRQHPELPEAEKLAEYFFENWLASEDHRVNILSESVTHEGIGVVRKGDTVYITVNFALPE